MDTLPNGLTVWHFEDHSVPVVAVNTGRRRSRRREGGAPGFAHLFDT
ncbi:MAG: hypothetical protein IPK12_18680 [Gemmatimonadetes bacterium]|nr:hypothetical protein [Gemmatimonadota bacterium]